MGNIWTEEQRKAIYENGTNLLVAAAAGSGKTAVLVERIINKIINENTDIDKILVVTFTNAAATEMRERILNTIYKKLEKFPENENLQKQLTLLNKANISTIHSFCLDIIKNNFYNLDISPNFRLASSEEIELLKLQILDEIFDKYYEEKNEQFIKLINIYGGYKDDSDLKEIILKIYNFIQSTPFPKKWLNEQVEKFNLQENINSDFSNTIWGTILISYLKDTIKYSISKLSSISKILNKENELSKFNLCILEDIENLKKLLNYNKWDDIYVALNNIVFKRWPTDKKNTFEIKDKAKEIRDNVKEEIDNLKKNVFIEISKNANEDIFAMYEILKSINDVIVNFIQEFQNAKKDKNIIDFSDIEHYALDILVKQDENGGCVPTDVAKKYQEKFEEIAIDEYQDSNLVQEYILSAVSKGNNTFMVGDVKQSIYKFRQARPELFLEKYNNYIEGNSTEKIGRKIKLFKNFRSRKNVLDLTNLIFENIMSKEIGDIDYDKDEFLSQGMEYSKTDENVGGMAELHVIDLSQDIEGEVQELIDNTQIEAKFVAGEIEKILHSNYKVWDKNKGYRKVEFKDIVILLRTTKGIANIFENEISNLRISCFL